LETPDHGASADDEEFGDDSLTREGVPAVVGLFALPLRWLLRRLRDCARCIRTQRLRK
jgi:hypothetical protein